MTHWHSSSPSKLLEAAAPGEVQDVDALGLTERQIVGHAMPPLFVFKHSVLHDAQVKHPTDKELC
jgi:hypothetical protein